MADTTAQATSESTDATNTEVQSFITRLIDSFDASGGGWVGVATFLVFAAWIANYVLIATGVVKYSELQPAFNDMMHAYEFVLGCFVGSVAHSTINNTILTIKRPQKNV